MGMTSTNEFARLYRKVPEPVRKVIRPFTGRYRPWIAAKKRISALTKEQQQCWEEQGYLILPNFISPDRIHAVNELIDRLWAKRDTLGDAPIAIDPYLGTPKERRTLFRDVAADARSQNYKLYDLYLESPLIRDTVLDANLADILWALLGEEPLVCNTINFEWGSEQDYHFDTWYMPPPERDRLIASWIALEDVSAAAGPLKYVPGSHKIPPFIFQKSGSLAASFDELPEAHEYIEREMAQRSLREQVFTGKAGDVFLWHAQLLHGGMPVQDRTKTRRSLVTHYWRWCDYLFAPIRTEGPGRRFLMRPHQKIPA